MAREEQGRSWRFVTMEVHGVTDADARGSEAIYKDGKLVGRATSGGYGWRLGKSLALAMVMEIKILGQMYKVTVIEESPFDPTNERLRAA